MNKYMSTPRLTGMEKLFFFFLFFFLTYSSVSKYKAKVIVIFDDISKDQIFWMQQTER